MRVLLPWLGFLCACAGRHVTIEGTALQRVSGRVALLPAAVADPSAVDAFRQGTAIGHLTLSGGYVEEARAHGTEHVSAQVVLTDADAYLARAQRTLETLVTTILSGRGSVVVPVDGRAPSPDRSELEGPYRGLGHDNQPLPRFRPLPVRLPGELLAMLPAGVDLVVVPWVVRFYSHTPGWFRGQTYGCAAGARLRVLVVAHDPVGGAALAWTDLDVAAMDRETEVPTTAAIEALRLAAEERLERSAKRHLLR